MCRRFGRGEQAVVRRTTAAVAVKAGKGSLIWAWAAVRRRGASWSKARHEQLMRDAAGAYAQLVHVREREAAPAEEDAAAAGAKLGAPGRAQEHGTPARRSPASGGRAWPRAGAWRRRAGRVSAITPVPVPGTGRASSWDRQRLELASPGGIGRTPVRAQRQWFLQLLCCRTKAATANPYQLLPKAESHGAAGS